VTCSTNLDDSGPGSFWKVTINKCAELADPTTFIGIIGHHNCSNMESYTDPSCFGWASGNEVWVGGNSRTTLCTFTEGDYYYFRFQGMKLCSMHSIQKNETFFMKVDELGNIDGEIFHIHFNFSAHNTSVTLGPLDAEERTVFEETYACTNTRK